MNKFHQTRADAIVAIRLGFSDSFRTVASSIGQPPKSFDDSEDNPDDPSEPNPLLKSGRAKVVLVRPDAAGSGSSVVATCRIDLLESGDRLTPAVH
jgi:hypothetical protein